jgi:hypothetical protein
MLREIETHKVKGDLPQNQLKIAIYDEPGAGGASHLYVITGFDTATNPSDPLVQRFGGGVPTEAKKTILFQNGPIKDFGVNGITQEALLAIVIDRLEAFQAGPFPSAENADALAHCQLALEALQTRTRKRLARGVEGTLNP